MPFRRSTQRPATGPRGVGPCLTVPLRAAPADAVAGVREAIGPYVQTDVAEPPPGSERETVRV